MDFYLVRHGDAKSEQEDSRRPLSDQGRRDVEKVARAAAAQGIKVWEILHSDKLRAKETAEILAQSLYPQAGVREMPGLSPLDDPLLAKAELEEAQNPLMLVGHLPHLSRLTSLLVVGHPEDEVLAFSPAAIVCISRVAESWQIRWTLNPQSF